MNMELGTAKRVIHPASAGPGLAGYATRNIPL